MATTKNKKPLEFGMNAQEDANQKGKGNFTTALKEIFGEKEAPMADAAVNKTDSSATQRTVATATMTDAQKRAAGTAANNTPASSTTSGGSSSPLSSNKPATPSTPAQSRFTPPPVIEETFITKDTIIEGSIITKSNIKISGCMKGNLISENDIFINGQIDGDVKGNSIVLNGGVVQGNITSSGHLALDDKSIVIGDLVSETVDSDGKVKGNINVTTSVSIKSNAIVHGNIKSKNINMLDGSVIKGSLEIVCDVPDDGDDLFAITDINTSAQ